MNRPLLLLTGGALLLLVAGGGGIVWLSLRAGALGDRLVREANTHVRATWPRPSHVDAPTPGSFARALEPLMAEVLRLQTSADREVLDKDKACLPVEKGAAPFESLAEPCRVLLDSRRDVLQRVLAATRTEAGGLPPGLSELSDPQHPFQRGGLLALRNLSRFAGLEIRRRLAQGDVGAAVDTCLDALALSRELALGSGLYGLIPSSAGSESLYQPCASALDAAPLERKRRALGQLARLRQGFPPLSEVLRSHSVATQLSHYGGLLSEEQLRALEPPVRAMARAQLDANLLPGPSLLARHHWRTSVKGFDALVAVADLPAGERQKAFARLYVALGQRWFLVPPEDVSILDDFANRAHRRGLLLDALHTLVAVDLARAEQGHWPTTLPPGATPLSLEVTSPTEAHLRPSDQTLEGYALRLTADTPP